MVTQLISVVADDSANLYHLTGGVQYVHEVMHHFYFFALFFTAFF